MTAVEMELSQVPLAPVLRILGQELLTDPELAERVRAQLAEQAGAPHRRH
ncbi:hypothetical protein [Streptomyces liangshanensis]